MAFTNKDKTDVRRFMGYPPIGTDGGRIFLGAIVNEPGLLEHRLEYLTVEEIDVLEGYLKTLRELETAIPAAAANLDASALGPLNGNPYEIAQRMALFDEWRRRLCEFLDIPPGPSLRRGNGRTFVV